MLRVFKQAIAPIYKLARDKAGEVSTRLQENLSGVVVIKIFGREQAEARRFREATEGVLRSQIRSINRRSLFFPVQRGWGS